MIRAMPAQRRGGTGLIDMNDLMESFSRKSAMPGRLHDYRQWRKKQEAEAELAILNSPPLDRAAIWRDCLSRTPSATKQ